MNDNSIVKKLFETKRSIRFDEIENEELDDKDDDIEDEEDFETPEDDSKDSEKNPEPEDNTPEKKPPIPRHSNSRREADDKEEEEPEDSEPEDSDPTEKKNEAPKNEYINPLDNAYAVHYTMGDEVSMRFSNSPNAIIHGTVDGYDPEGFYRILWDDGLTTNGFTDITLADFVKRTNESRCICGHKNFVTEGNYVVCDRCGRRIRENKTLDKLSLEDKSRPKNKRMIRSEAHPLSTATRPNISEAIKDALKKPTKESLKDRDPFWRLFKLQGEFWTTTADLIEDIEDLGFTVDEHTEEYIIISTNYGDEDHSLLIPISGTSYTKTLDLNKVEEV